MPTEKSPMSANLFVAEIDDLDDFETSISAVAPDQRETAYSMMLTQLGPLAIKVYTQSDRDQLIRLFREYPQLARLEYQYTVENFQKDYEELKRPWYKCLHRGFLHQLQGADTLEKKYYLILDYTLEHPNSDAAKLLESMHKTPNSTPSTSPRH